MPSGMSCLKGYPRFGSDLRLASKEKGLLTFISDHIIDVEFFEEVTPAEKANIEPPSETSMLPVGV